MNGIPKKYLAKNMVTNKCLIQKVWSEKVSGQNKIIGNE